MQQMAASLQPMPADHPPVGAQSSSADLQAQREQVMASIEKARNEPKNFEAQIEAADLYYRIQRFNEAIEFLLKRINSGQPIIERLPYSGWSTWMPVTSIPRRSGIERR